MPWKLMNIFRTLFSLAWNESSTFLRLAILFIQAVWRGYHTRSIVRASMVSDCHQLNPFSSPCVEEISIIISSIQITLPSFYYDPLLLITGGYIQGSIICCL